MTIDEEDETGNSQNWRLMSKTAQKLEMLYSNYDRFLRKGSDKDEKSAHKSVLKRKKDEDWCNLFFETEQYN